MGTYRRNRCVKSSMGVVAHLIALRLRELPQRGGMSRWGDMDHAEAGRPWGHMDRPTPAGTFATVTCRRGAIEGVAIRRYGCAGPSHA
jgi:hypothetical protein